MISTETGNTITITMTSITPTTGVLTDATTVTIKVLDPTGTKTTGTLAGGQVVRDSLGTYHYNLPITLAGQWQYTWITTTPAGSTSDVITGVSNKVT